MKTGLVLEGGAMRGMYTAGVLDVIMENHITFHGAIGVSAGAAFGSNLKSGQIGRTIRYNLRFCKDWRYSSWRSFFLTGDLYGAKFCYQKIPFELDPFDSESFARNPMEFHVVCTDMKTGKPVYHQCDKGEEEDMQWIRASASMPIVSRPVRIGNYYLSDGGSADSVPVKYFESIGYTRQVIILTRPLEYRKKPYSHPEAMKLALLRYPALASALINRWWQYNATMDYINKKEESGDLLVIRPAQPLPVGHISHDAEELKLTYEIGRTDGEKSIRKISEYLSK